MPDQATMLSRLGEVTAQAQSAADDYGGLIGSLKATIVEHFGQNGLYASYVVLAVLVLVVVSRLTKITFSTIKYLIIPSLALAFVVSMMTAYSFLGLLPVTVTVCSLILLFKG
ncbi:MAG: hypothetical protein ABIE70_11970 [bacterium]